MARRRLGRLDESLEAWARWCARDSDTSLGGSGRSMLARWMDAKGDMSAVFSGGSTVPADTLEGRIEIAVIELARDSQLAADVLRIEHDCRAESVAKSYGVTEYDPRGMGQVEKALTLSVSLRTYRRRLAQAREHVGAAIGIKP